MERYQRQIILPEIGVEGQQRLGAARVLIVGAGGLGSPVALYLAAAGVGTLGIADDDIVGITNLNRQILYAQSDCGLLKVERAATRIKALRGDIHIRTYQRVTAENAAEIISDYDIVVDACDNIDTRYVVSDAAAALQKPYIYGAIDGHEGQVSVFNFGSMPHRYRDLWPNEEEAKAHRPSRAVLGVTAGIVGCTQANEAIKIICGYGEVLAGRLWTIDLRTMQNIIVEL